MNRLIIEDLEVFYRIGVTVEERIHPQRLLLTIELADTFAQATASDSLADTIDYAALCSRLLRWGTDREWKLIERLAQEIADMILGVYQPAEVCVTVKKFVIPQARHVAFQLRRCRQPTTPSQVE